VVQSGAACCNMLQRVVVGCSMRQYVAVYCSVLQCVAVCCSMLQRSNPGVDRNKNTITHTCIHMHVEEWKLTGNRVTNEALVSVHTGLF